MRTLLLALILLCAPKPDTLDVMFWNLENFFDYRNDSTSVSDAEFSSRGTKRWTKKRFYAKCNAVAKGVLWVSAQKERLPDVIGLAEVENSFVLRRLIQATVLERTDYRAVHFDSPDRRGIDVALLYRTGSLELLKAEPCHIYEADSAIMRTRDILLAQFRTNEGTDVAILINHHPSKFGGAKASVARRTLAIKRLAGLADSLQGAGIRNIIAAGDFNDTPQNPQYSSIPLVNLAQPLYSKGYGTIKFAGKWELIDMFFVSEAIRPKEMEIQYVPFLQVPDKAAVGTKPRRTYSGPRYLGGVSDHCPIWMRAVF